MVQKVRVPFATKIFGMLMLHTLIITRFHLYDETRAENFLTLGKFDVFAALSFPDADISHLETCLAFLLWAFSVTKSYSLRI